MERGGRREGEKGKKEGVEKGREQRRVGHFLFDRLLIRGFRF